MKKMLMGLLCAVMLAGIFPAAASAQTNYDQLRQEIEELRSLINLLVQSMNNNQINVPTGQPGIPQISTQRARELAVAFLGQGTARDVVLFSDNNVLTFEVEVRHNNVRHMVYVNAANGDIIRMSRHEDGYVGITTLPEAVPPVIGDAGGITVGTVVPRAPARQGGPANPAFTAQRAVELARDHLVANGVTNARFNYVYMDIENGVWVWSIEFDGQGRSFEFYVNVNTGAFVRTPSGLGAAAAPPPAVAPPPPPPPPQQQHHTGGRGRGPAPQNPTVGQWWGSSYVWDGHRWNSSIGWGGGRGR